MKFKDNRALFALNECLTVADERADHEEGDGGGAGAGAEDGDVVRVAAEVADVLVDPLEGQQLVQKANIARH